MPFPTRPLDGLTPCVKLRVVPLSAPTGPEIRHDPRGYLQDGALLLERGMKLAVSESSCPSRVGVGEDGTLSYTKHTVDIVGHDGPFTVPVASGLEAAMAAVSLPLGLPDDTPVEIDTRVYRWDCQSLGSFESCANPVLLGQSILRASPPRLRIPARAARRSR